jgi:hypothetical protein
MCLKEKLSLVVLDVAECRSDPCFRREWLKGAKAGAVFVPAKNG